MARQSLELVQRTPTTENASLQMFSFQTRQKTAADYGDLSKGDKWQWTAAKAAMDCIYYCLEKTGGSEFSGKETVMT